MYYSKNNNQTCILRTSNNILQSIYTSTYKAYNIQKFTLLHDNT